MAAKTKITEAHALLKRLDSKYVATLNNLYRDKINFDVFSNLLSVLTNFDADKIIKGSAGANSMDSMINYTVESAYLRGRISMAALIKQLIVNAEREMIKRESDSKK